MKQVKFRHIDQVQFRQFLVIFPLVQVGNIDIRLVVPHPFLVIVLIRYLQLQIVQLVPGILGQRVQHHRVGPQVADGVLGFDLLHNQIRDLRQHPQDLLGSGFVLHDNGEKVVVEHGEAAHQLPLLLKRPHQGFIGDPHRHRHRSLSSISIISDFFE